ncbi:MAG: hypothetical protein M1839_001374 [Geoglossum umbratile]|nr:MAG: hypothetical protein M1839_001374 [Geoglossum umbratile]
MKRPTAAVGGKARVKPNGSILSFFKKVETVADDEGSLFFKDDSNLGRSSLVPEDSGGFDDLFGDPGEGARFNEDAGSIKRRRLGSEVGAEEGKGGGLFVSPFKAGDGAAGYPGARRPPPPPPLDFGESGDKEGGSRSASSESTSGSTEMKKLERIVGPFVEDSDSEEEVDAVCELTGDLAKLPNPLEEQEPEIIDSSISGEAFSDIQRNTGAYKPNLKLDEANISRDEEFGGVEIIEDYDDEYDGGEEMAERRWMEEQRRLEMAEGGVDPDFIDDFSDEDSKMLDLEVVAGDGEGAAVCPICCVSLEGVTNADTTLHVNRCLDGDPIPLPECIIARPTTPLKRFQRPIKPAQPSPFSLGSTSSVPSAFSKLMSSRAEDEAWATAAAAEAASRGKPAYQRSCPFYKIIPGFFICVDAFRYGAVAGCNAYFLSHFHSDHYIGLTASWCHGPIYCSRATGNLVRQQLRVDPKWVVDVEFEKKTEVPDTNGVEVTMIDANHCPGSSLFLFEKVVRKGKNPKVQRVLHCGDFRACVAHIQHPLLQPDIYDPVSGKRTGRQQIDVCYLDTTYLNPRYSFPSQEEVINACATMCANLEKGLVSGGDAWERMLMGRSGRAMAKFVGKRESSSKPSEGINGSTTKTPAAARLLVIVGTYSIGKERICMGIARALNTKIYAPPNKQKICSCLEDPSLNALLTTDPRKAQVHMTPLGEISTDALSDYLKSCSPHFSHILGIRPSGWNYKPPRRSQNPTIHDILHSPAWKSPFGPGDLLPQRGATMQVASFAVPYSEHSSFRELAMFCCGLHIVRVVPTVGVGSAKVREEMREWLRKWEGERRRAGFFRVDGEGGGAW